MNESSVTMGGDGSSTMVWPASNGMVEGTVTGVYNPSVEEQQRRMSYTPPEFDDNAAEKTKKRKKSTKKKVRFSTAEEYVGDVGDDV